MSRGAPKRRRPKDQKDPDVGDPVRIYKTDESTQLGEVKSLIGNYECTNVCVETADGEVVTMAKRVEVVSGVDATQARQEAERGDND